MAAQLVGRPSPLDRLTWRQRQGLTAYQFLTPALLLMTVFFFIPLVIAVIASLYDFPLIRPDRREFIGLDNYRSLFADSEFRTALRNTFIYAGIQAPAQTILGLVLALLVEKTYRGVAVFRTMFYLPVVISMVVASVIWVFLYDADSGLINSALRSLGLPGQPFLRSTTQALPSIAAMLTWKWVGFSMIIFLAGLQAIPAQYYEAAKVDGCSAFKRFWHITLPLLKRASLFVIVINTVNSFKLFTPIYVITQGGPELSTTVLVYYLYREAFRFYAMGRASAVAIIMLALVLVVMAIQFRLLRSDVRY